MNQFFFFHFQNQTDISEFIVKVFAHWVWNHRPKFSHVKKINTTSCCVNQFEISSLIGKDDAYEKTHTKILDSVCKDL